MKKNLERNVEIPEGINVSFANGIISVSGNGKEAKKKFDFGKILCVVEGNSLKLSAKNASKRESKMMGTISSHIKNMIKGINEDYVYKMEICNVHFPMNVKSDGKIITIKSFLGESIDRTAKILDGVKVEIKGNEIVISSSDVEKAGQTATNIERATKLRGRDRRIFQDGIFITEKPGRKI